MDKITSDIKKGNIKNVYLFYGEDAYKRRVYKNLLKETLFSNEMNYSYFEGDKINWQAVYDVCAEVPFFAQKRLVVVENSGRFKMKAAKGTSKGADDLIIGIIGALPESTCLVFIEQEAAKSKKIYKSVQKKGVVCECAHDSVQTVAAWLKKGFAQSGKRIEDEAVYELIERCTVDYESLKCEYEKLMAYAGDRPVITKADVEELTGQSTQAKVFEITQACIKKDQAKMLDIYYALTENEVHPLVILAALRSQFELMLQIMELDSARFSDKETAERLGKAEFIIRNTKKIIYAFTRPQTEAIIEKITLTDKQIKDGDAIEKYAVEMLLMEISGQMRQTYAGKPA